MKKYEVVMDFVCTATIVVEARDEEAAENKAWCHVHSKKGFDEYIGVAAPRNVLFGKNMYEGDGFEVALVSESDGELADGCIEV